MWYSLSDTQYAKPITAIDIDSRVIAYGDGFFTTMAVVAGQINWLSYHLDRIDESVHALQLNLTDADLDAANLESPNHTIRAYFNSQLANFAKILNHGMLKLIVCRRNQPIKGYGFCNSEFDAFIKLIPTHKPLAQQANQVIIQPAATAICLTQQIACLPKPLVGLKLLNAQDKVMASHELWQHQTQDAQMIDAQMIDGLVQDVMGHWVEGTFCNVFYQLNHENVWYTPPINRSGVKGVMRQILLAKFAKYNRAHEERYLASEELSNITSLFFCNAVRGILPIQVLMLPNGQSKALDLTPIYTQKFT